MRGGANSRRDHGTTMLDKSDLLRRFGLESAPGFSGTLTGFAVDKVSDNGTEQVVDIWDVGPDADTSSDEDGVKRPKRGAGRLGKGPPVMLDQGIKARAFEDGAGLCSPGRWMPENRKKDTVAIRIHRAVRDIV